MSQPISHTAKQLLAELDRIMDEPDPLERQKLFAQFGRTLAAQYMPAKPTKGSTP